MECPNCHQKYLYLSKVEHGRDYNWLKGFKCPYCSSIIKFQSVKKGGVVIFALFISLLIALKMLESYQKFLNQDLYFAIATYLVPATMLIFMIFYFIEKGINFKVVKKGNTQKEFNIEIPYKKVIFMLNKYSIYL